MSASRILAKLQRWKELNLRFFVDIQPIITNTESILNGSCNMYDFRDNILHEISTIHSQCQQKIIDEQIEIAYSDLMGYNENVEKCFSNAINGLKYIDNLITLCIFYNIQQELADKNLVVRETDVLCIDEYGRTYKDAELGNNFQRIINMNKLETECLMGEIIKNFGIEINGLITGKDNDIVDKKIIINTGSRTAYLQNAIKALTLRFEGSEEDVKGRAEAKKGDIENSVQHDGIAKHKFKDAILYYEAAINNLEKISNMDTKTEFLAGLHAGRCLSQRGIKSYDEAEKSLEKAKNLYRESRNEKLLLPNNET